MAPPTPTFLQELASVGQAIKEAGRELGAEVARTYRESKVRGILTALLVAVVVLALVLLVIGYGIYTAGHVAVKLARAGGRAASQAYQVFMHRHFETVGLLGSLLVVLGATYGLYWLDPNTPTLSPATLQVLLSAPLLLFVIVHSAIYTHKHLFPETFRALLKTIGAKLTEDALPPLDQLLGASYKLRIEHSHGADSLALAGFILKYHLLKFVLRCTRFVLFGLPLYLLFVAMQALVTLLLNLTPH